ncbi:hypothetical protein [Streptomyces liangshanensis]|uniref:Uncharacterized protein n=1 Tax=Streptomyces liangshanensis TaxID=2717324 RepID=A0A6G9GYG9_9ACTN|nr:hypothetical protein [Streptomyces liangshanensis]QIQ03099.1 hypothetical protein HA039_12870 [Streptomyces liangshanensis]
MIRVTRRGRTAAVRATVLGVGALFVLAPVGVTPRGCGDLSGGRLCIEGPIGGKGGFTTRYVQHDGGPDLAVRLGYQRKDDRLTAFADWFGTRRTRDGVAALGGHLDTEPGECIRGVLLDPEGQAYVTQWQCDD